MTQACPEPTAGLDAWLAWLETIHPTSIDMSLERVRTVAQRASLASVSCPLIIVGGTNGKGSTVGLLARAYALAGYRVGAYTSPHIDLFNERICINGEQVADADIVSALAYVESHRAPETLTYFEYTTLAAMRVFTSAECDVVVLEVGLGGRLDATNLWDADCAIVTSIAIDHESYLGSDRAGISLEKVAIGRSDRPMIVGDVDPPPEMLAEAARQGMRLRQISPSDLPDGTGMRGAHQRRNAACAIAAVEFLQGRLPVPSHVVSEALRAHVVAGRFEELMVNGRAVVLDVAHNPAAAIAVAETLASSYPEVAVHAVFAVLGDKDIPGVVNGLSPVVSHWYCAPLEVPRGISAQALAQVVRSHSSAPCDEYPSVAAAAEAAHAAVCATSGLVLVAGSFYTVAQWRVHSVS